MSGTIKLLYGGWKEISARTQQTLADYADRVYTRGDDGGGLRGRRQPGMSGRREESGSRRTESERKRTAGRRPLT